MRDPLRGLLKKDRAQGALLHRLHAAVYPCNQIQTELRYAMSEYILSLSDFKADASQLLKRMRDEDATPLVLTQNGRASAVVQSYEDYQQLQKSLAMMKLVSMGEADVASGKVAPQDEVFAKARARLVKRLKADD